MSHDTANMGRFDRLQSRRLREIAARNADELARIDYVQARLLAEACGVLPSPQDPIQPDAYALPFSTVYARCAATTQPEPRWSTTRPSDPYIDTED